MNANSDKLSVDKQVNRGLGRRIVGLFQPYRGRVAVIGLLVLVAAGLEVVNPLMIPVVFDRGLFPESGGPNLELL